MDDLAVHLAPVFLTQREDGIEMNGGDVREA
jgi:hypothetical protein